MGQVKENFCINLHQHMFMTCQVWYMHPCWLVRVLGDRIISKKSGSISCWCPRLLYHSLGIKNRFFLGQRMAWRGDLCLELKKTLLLRHVLRSIVQIGLNFFSNVLNCTCLKLAILSSMLIFSYLWVFLLYMNREENNSETRDSKQFSYYKYKHILPLICSPV